MPVAIQPERTDNSRSRSRSRSRRPPARARTIDTKRLCIAYVRPDRLDGAAARWLYVDPDKLNRQFTVVLLAVRWRCTRSAMNRGLGDTPIATHEVHVGSK